MSRIVIIIWFVIALFATNACAQYKRALNLIEDNKLEKAERFINKRLAKEPADAGLMYTKSLLYSHNAFLDYNLDSGYQYAKKAINLYDSAEQRKKIHRSGIDSASLHAQKLRIDSLAFDQVKKFNSIDRYNEFLIRHPEAPQFNKAVSIRDSLAFQKALEGNTMKALREFIENYSGAHQAAKARLILDSLSFASIKNSRDVEDLKQYIEQNPVSRFSNEAEHLIFRYTTYSHQEEAYLNFIRQYPGSYWSEVALNFLYHLHKEYNPPEIFVSHYDELAISDSLRHVIEAESSYCVPFIEEDRFGFLHADGSVIIPPRFEAISEDYFCGNIEDDYLFVEEEGKLIITGRTGLPIIRGPVDEVFDLGAGLLMVSRDNRKMVAHKSGRTLIKGNYDNFKVIQNALIAFKVRDRWGIKTINGTDLLKPEYHSIDEIDSFVLLEKEEKIAVSSKGEILRAFDSTLNFNFRFSDVELLEPGRLIVKNDGFEGLMNDDLQMIVPFAFHEIHPIENGYLIKSEGLYKVFLSNIPGSNNEWYESVMANQNWMGTRKKSKWRLLNLKTLTVYPKEYDSLNLLSDNIALTVTGDSTNLHFITQKIQSFPRKDQVKLIKSSQGEVNAEYIYHRDPGKETELFNKVGELIFTGEIDEITVLGPDYLLVGVEGKKGLLDKNGKLLLSPEYDAIGNYQSGYVSTLKEKRFGLFNALKTINIDPEYQQMVKLFTSEIFMANKEGKWGLIDSEENVILDFEYDEMVHWTDSVVLAKKGYQWHFNNIFTQEETQDPVNSFTYISSSPTENTLKIYRSSGYGILSSLKGLIVPDVYTDIINLGNTGKPLYLAEKHIPEADYFVVVYYDYAGNMIRRQGFTPEEYDRIYCN